MNNHAICLRHYLNTESLSEAELNDIQVASSDSSEVFSVENMERVEAQTFRTSSTGTKAGGFKLLGQMHRLVRGGSSPASGAVGVVVLTLHKANNIEKKGLVGKADPYVVMEVRSWKYLDI